jgi:hypothetical protein
MKNMSTGLQMTIQYPYSPKKISVEFMIKIFDLGQEDTIEIKSDA